ncbi:Hypothetical protein A7982_07020 [Minicystis rosea]|nr:Hypothetical protein A7982_07020 [Minicystis rosea]
MCIPLSVPCDPSDFVGSLVLCLGWCSATCGKPNVGFCQAVGSNGFCVCP